MIVGFFYDVRSEHSLLYLGLIFLASFYGFLTKIFYEKIYCNLQYSVVVIFY